MIKNLSSKDIVDDLFNDVLDHTNESVTLFVPGGSFLPRLDELLGKIRDKDLSNLTIALTDERYGENLESNWYKISKLENFNAIQSTGIKFKHIRDDIEFDDSVQEYNNFVRDVFEMKNTKNKGHIIMVLGVGYDSHLAGIMPHNYEEKGVYWKDLVAGKKGKNSEDNNYDRITLTFLPIGEMDKIYLYSGSEDKDVVIRRAIEYRQEFTLEELGKYPTLLLKNTPELLIYWFNSVGKG